LGIVGRGRRGRNEGREGGKEGIDGKGEKVGRGDGGLDLDICPGDPEFLVMPLH